MPEFRRRLIALAAAAALALAPAAAYGQGAGDDQYEDPFGDEQEQPTATPAPRRPAATATATPRPVQPAATATAQPPSATATPAPTLPYTGLDDGWLAGIGGALLLGAGLTLRARLREPD
jgi:LPXTG-motif cell wall-anchored protein